VTRLARQTLQRTDRATGRCWLGISLAHSRGQTLKNPVGSRGCRFGGRIGLRAAVGSGFLWLIRGANS